MFDFDKRVVSYKKNALVLVGSSIFILLVFWLLLIYKVFPSITEVAHNSMKTQLELLKQDSLEDLERSILSLERIAKELSTIDLERELTSNLIDNITYFYPVFDQVTVINKEHNIVHQAPIKADLVIEGDEERLVRVINEKRTIFTEIEYNSSSELMFISIISPIINQNHVMGVVKGTFDIHQNFFNPTIMNAKLGETGSTFLVDRNGDILSHRKNDIIGLNAKDILVENVLPEALRSINEDGGVAIVEYKTHSGNKGVLATTLLIDNLLVGVSYDQSELYAPKIQLQNAFILITILTLIIVTVLGFWFNRKIAMPIMLLSEQADKIAKGDLNAPFPKERDNETTHIINALKKVLKEKDKLFLQTIETISKTLEKKDLYTAGHSERVTEYALILANEMELSEEEKKDLQLGALLHDIGKIGVPDSVLLKSGKLTDEEFEEIKRHTVYGDEIISNMKSLKHIRPIIRSHHERWDGKGYPDGLKGNEIQLLARITCVADAYDAMTSDRPYRKGLDDSRAIEIIKKESGKQFDPDVVTAFLKWKLKGDYN